MLKYIILDNKNNKNAIFFLNNNNLEIYSLFLYLQIN